MVWTGSQGMAGKEFTEKDSKAELSRARKIAARSKEAKKQALALVKHLEQEEVPDLKQIKALHERLVREEKALARLLKPVARKGMKRKKK